MKKCFVAGKFIWLLVAAMLIALFWCGAAFATSSGSCGDNLFWTLDDEGNLRIYGTGSMTYYPPDVPSGDSIYFTKTTAPWGTDVTSATIEEGVSKISSYAFAGCDLRNGITIASSVEEIDNRAFFRTGLRNITIPNNVTYIASGTFWFCSNLKIVDLPDSLESISTRAFALCSSLENIRIPDGVKRIGDEAFFECDEMTSIIFPASLTNIWDSAFENCSALTDVYYTGTEEQKSQIKIGTRNYYLINAVWHCNYIDPNQSGICGDDLTWIRNNEGNLTISGTGPMWDYTDDNPAPWGTGIKFVTIENGATSIGNNAFSGCWDLEGVSIGNGVTSIGDYAFDDCVNLLLITSSQHITSIGEGAFSGCSSLEAFEFKNCETVGAHAFENCISLQVANLPAVSVLSDYLFYDCWNLNSLDISSCTSIGNYTFAGCNNLTLFSFGGKTTSVGKGAFQDCINLKSVTISDDCKASFGDYAFRDCSKMTYITIPKSITDFGIDVFAGHSENLIAYVYENSAAHIYCSDHSIRCHFLTDQSFGNGFDLRRDGWALQNTQASFFYPSNYMIPWDRYAEVFGISSVASEIVMNHFEKPMLQEEWAGNCAGLAMLAIWNYVGKIDLREYFSNTEGKSLCEYGYDELRKFFGVYAIKDQNVIKLIERAQLGQFTNARRNVEVFTAHDNSTRFAALIDYLQNNKTPLYISIHKEDGTGGHALVTNTANPPEPTTYNNDNKYYRIKVYDCIYPYDVESSLGNDPYYTQAEDCWLYVNPVNGKWHYRNYVDGSIWFFDVASMNTNFIGSINRPVSPEEFVVFLNSVETILDQDNGRYVWNNNISNIGTNVRFFPCCDGASDSSGSSRFGGTVVFPRSDKPISVSGQNDTYALFMSSDKILYAHTDDESTYEADVENNSITLHSSDNCTFDIVLDNDDSEVYSAVVLTGTASEGTTTITLNEDNTISAESTAEDFNAEVTLSGSELDEDTTYQCDDIKELNGVSMSNGTVVRMGTCGDQLIWKLYLDSGRLVISGTGEMYDYDDTTNLPPWGTKVKTVQVQNGVTSIGKFAFYNATKLSAITLPSSVTAIGISAFNNCSSLSAFAIPNKVTSISNNTFRGCSSLTSVTIPNSVTSIGICAFYECSSLSYITIPSSVTSIGRVAFSYCTSLADITIPGSLTADFDGYVFAHCSNLTNVTIENGVTDIGPYMFYGCSGLSTITIPESVACIRNNSFENCTSLTSVTLLGSLTNGIGHQAFRNCTSLQSITISAGMTSINCTVFENCTALDRIEVSEENTEFTSVDGVVFSKDKSRLVWVPPGRAGMYVIPDGVTTIGYIYGVETPTYTGGPGSSGYDPFYKCTGLTDVIIPNSVTSIGQCAFSSCTGLTRIIIPNSVTFIDREVFEYCSNLTSVVIPPSVTTICHNLFYGCGENPIVTVAENSAALQYCIDHNIAYVISDDMPMCCGICGDNLIWTLYTSGTLHIDGTGEMYDYLPDYYNRDLSPWLRDTDISVVIINAGVTSIGDHAFQECSGLTSITIPNSLTTIGDGAFYKCDGLSINTLPNGVTNIGDLAFYRCNNLTCITIPEGVIDIGSNAFGYCENLEEIWLPDSITSIAKATFQGCEKLKAIRLSDSMTSISDHAFYICSSLTHITIPNSVASIGDYAFGHCTSLKEIKLSDRLTSIGNHVFDMCNSLAGITLPDSIISIGDYAFNVCSRLSNITIPGSVTSIGDHAFYYCSGISSITMPDSIMSISAQAFYHCSGLKTVYYTGTATQRESIEIDSDGNDPLQAARWIYPKNSILILPSGLTSIASKAFIGLPSDTYIRIPESVTSIAYDAFDHSVVIFAHSNSYAANWAAKNGFNYVTE